MVQVDQKWKTIVFKDSFGYLANKNSETEYEKRDQHMRMIVYQIEWPNYLRILMIMVDDDCYRQ